VIVRVATDAIEGLVCIAFWGAMVLAASAANVLWSFAVLRDVSPDLTAYTSYWFSLVLAWVELLFVDVDTISEGDVCGFSCCEVEHCVCESLLWRSPFLWFDPLD